MPVSTVHGENVSIPQLDELPTEIQDLIFDHVVAGLTRSDLKRFRQSNRFFRDRADIKLFQTLHISASKLSLNRVRAISESPHLSCHVRELVYHRGTFSGHKMVHYSRGTIAPRDYGDFEEYMMRGEPTFRPAQKDMMRVSQCFVAFSEEVKAEADFNREFAWQNDMQKYCAQFHNLETLTTLSDQDDLQSEYLKRRCGLTHQSWTPNYFAPYEIFGPCGVNFRPKALRMDSVNGEDFAALITNIRGGPAAVRERFSALRELNIRFSETVVNLSVEGTYDIFIASCQNLRSLSLDFLTFYSPKILKDPNSLPQKLISNVLRQRFPRLTHLDLKYPIMLESEFIDFLKEHRHCLRNIQINRWPMPVTPQGQATGSVIRALYSMGQVDFTSLSSLTVHGELSSTKSGDGWNIKPIFDNESTLSTRIHQYLNRQGPSHAHFPIQVDVQQMSAAKGSREFQALDEAPYKLGAFDYSFLFHGGASSAPHLALNRMIIEEDEDWTGEAGWLAGTSDF